MYITLNCPTGMGNLDWGLTTVRQLWRHHCSCCVSSCDMGKYQCIWQDHDWKPEKKRKYMGKNIFYI